MLTYDVTLCIGTDNPDKRISVKCHDTGINFRVYLALLRRSKWREIHDPYDIPPGSTAVLKIAKPDRTYVLTDGVVESDDIVFTPPPQSFTAAGTASAEVSLFGPDGRRLTTSTFYIEVPKECVCDCEEESATYVDVMAQQIKAAQEAAERAETAAVRQPYIGENGNWHIWDIDAQTYKDTGVSAGGSAADAVIDPGEVITIVDELPPTDGPEQVVYLVDDPTDGEAGWEPLLIEILSKAVYNEDQTANISALAELLGVGTGDTPEDDTGGVTQIANKLVITGGVTVEQIGATLKLT